MVLRKSLRPFGEPYPAFDGLPPVAALGLASRGNTHLTGDDVANAIERGIGYLNWCGHDDGLAAAVRNLGASERARVIIATQLDARDADDAERELDAMLETLGTDYLDVVTAYYLESDAEWRQIQGRAGARTAIEAARSDGRVRRFGFTSHQRPLARDILDEGSVDVAMVRYNAAHRGAEAEIFHRALATPIVAFTCTRWGALLEATDQTPAMSPPDCYRFALAHPAVTVALTAPNDRRELEANLATLDAPPPTEDELALWRRHGDRVRATAGRFP
ncbi:MAG: aldo/keto reductase [Deltaproteobacteria bacterium]|jgi:predicted aldo/keto reductase-like oxidoreductase